MLIAGTGVDEMINEEAERYTSVPSSGDSFVENELNGCPPTIVSSSRNFKEANEPNDWPTYTEHTEWIPHYVMAEWENNDGVRCITIIVNLSSGTANSSSAGIDVDLDNDGNTLFISERWSDMTQDMDVFYSRFQQRPGEGDDDFTERRFAMRRTLRKMQAKHADDENMMLSVFRKPLSFRVEPSEMRVVFSGDKVGGRYCHIDLIEKKIQAVQNVFMMDDITNNNVPMSAKKLKYKTSKLL